MDFDFLHKNTLKLFKYIFLLTTVTTCGSYPRQADLPRTGKIRCNIQMPLSGNLCEDEIDFLETMRADPRVGDPRLLLRETLITLSWNEGYPKAVALFYLTVNSAPETKQLLETYGRTKKKPDMHNYRMIFVPGMFYDRMKDVGGQGDFIRNTAVEMGMEEEMIPVLPAGSVRENGKMICNRIQSLPQGKKIIFTSISKGGADFKQALLQCGNSREFRKVAGWLNIAGLNRGSFLANKVYSDFSDRVKSKLFFYVNDYDYEGVRSLQVDPESDLYRNPQLPSSLKVLNVIPATLHRHVTSRTDESFRALLEYGPNDGYTAVADSYIPGAVNLSVWGVDHFFQMQIDKKRELLREAFYFFSVSN